jgi:genome maintenance exonuclease 1
MMCSKDNFYQEFVIEGEELKKYKHDFLRKVDQYYKQTKLKEENNETERPTTDTI